jgi:NAD(P)H dehydrogenase (quinone)
MTVAVTGASGQLGRLVVDDLLSRVEPAEIVLTSRKPESLAAYAERGVTVRSADFDDPASLGEAFAGVDRLLLISTDVIGRRVEGHQAAIDAARGAGVRHIVYTSIPGTIADNPAGVVPDHALTEFAIRESGLDWTFLRNNLYADMQVPTLQQAAAAGRWVTNAGAGATAYVTRADCASVAAAVLASDGHVGRAYDVTGPEAHDALSLAALASELGHKQVEVVSVDDEAYAAGLVEHAGLPEAFAQLLASFGASARLGFLDTVTSAVADLTGRAPESLADLLR